MECWMAVFGAGVVIGGLLGCTSNGNAVQKPAPASARTGLAGYESRMGVRFPASARVLNVHEELRGPDKAIYLKIAIAKEDVTKLLAASPLASVTLRTDRRFVSNNDAIPWWDPEASAAYRSAQVELPGAAWLNILIRLDDADEVVVYLMWHET